MAKVTNQAIPPSLKAEYSDVLRVPRATPPFSGTVGIIPSARGRPGLPMPKATLRYVQDAVRWLYENWRPLGGGIDPALWRAERRAEIVRLEFPEPYWYTVPASSYRKYCPWAEGVRRMVDFHTASRPLPGLSSFR